MGGETVTKRLRWPNEAEYARQNALYNANIGLESLIAILRNRCNSRAEEIQKLAIVTDCLHRIRFDLEAVGPGKEKSQAAVTVNNLEMA